MLGPLFVCAGLACLAAGRALWAWPLLCGPLFRGRLFTGAPSPRLAFIDLSCAGLLPVLIFLAAALKELVRPVSALDVSALAVPALAALDLEVPALEVRALKPGPGLALPPPRPEVLEFGGRLAI